MILIDDRIGSAEVIGYLRHWKVPCSLSRLEYGDACFLGNGPRGPMPIGIEIKKVRDALNCMCDGRFAGGQLPGLLRTYERVWLVVEGGYGADFNSGILRDGTGKRDVVTGIRRYTYREFDHWLTSMEQMAGMRLRRTVDRVETARVIASLASWFAKPWEDHKSHLAMDTSQQDWVVFSKPSLARRVAAQLPGVGFKKSEDVARAFPTVWLLACASEEDLAEVPGIGKTLAKRIFDAINSR